MVYIEDPVQMIDFVFQEGCGAVFCNQDFIGVFQVFVLELYILRSLNHFTLMSWERQTVFTI